MSTELRYLAAQSEFYQQYSSIYDGTPDNIKKSLDEKSKNLIKWIQEKVEEETKCLSDIKQKQITQTEEDIEMKTSIFKSEW